MSHKITVTRENFLPLCISLWTLVGITAILLLAATWLPALFGYIEKDIQQLLSATYLGIGLFLGLGAFFALMLWPFDNDTPPTKGKGQFGPSPRWRFFYIQTKFTIGVFK